MGCTALKEATVPGADLYSASSLFRDCTALESITFKSGVTDLGEHTFDGCTGLKYVVVPVSLTEDLGWSMFSDCVSMTDMYYEGTRDQFLACDYISLDNDDTFTTIYSNPPHKVKVHFNSTGPEDVPHEHSYSTDWKSDAANHWHECSCGDKSDTAAHTFTWVTDKAATVTETGLKHEECTVCGYKRNENTVIDKLPDTHTHSYSKDWKTDATNHWHECSCGDKKDTAAHTFTWITDKAATATLPGVKHEECTVCGYKRNENTRIDPTGSDPVPVTERYASGYTDKDSVTYTGKVMSGNIIVYDRETLEEIPAKGNYDIKWSVDGKSIGKQKFTVTFKGDYVNSDPYTDTFTILPGKGKITSVKPGKKQAVVKYKALKGGVKYQVAYRISGAWKTRTASGTSLTIKKLKSKKTYQFRVRAFKTVKGKTYYGSWSATKKAKIK